MRSVRSVLESGTREIKRDGVRRRVGGLRVSERGSAVADMDGGGRCEGAQSRPRVRRGRDTKEARV